MCSVYIVTGKVGGRPDPFVVAVYANSLCEAVDLAKRCARGSSFKVIKNSFFAVELNELLVDGIKVYVPVPHPKDSWIDADLTDYI